MPKIIIRNSCIMIRDYVLGSCPQLERNFMVYDPIRHTKDVLGMYYSAKTSTLYIPRGLDIPYIKHCLHIHDHENEQPSKFKETDYIGMKYKPRDKEQEEALKFMIGIGEHEQNLYEPQLSVNLNTGKGKTYCSIATISYMRIKSIVITGSITLLHQWERDIEEYTQLRRKDILFINGSDMMNMIYQGKSKRAEEASIFLCTHGTIRSYCDTNGWSRLNTIFENLGIGMKFIDEAHTNFVNMLMIDFFSNVFKTYYVTATPGRSSRQEDKIYQLSIKNVPGIDLFDENKDPHTDYIAMKYNSHPSALVLSSCRNKYGLDRMKYVDFITQNEYFYQMMRIVMEMFLKCGGRGLFYVGTNAGIVRVYHWICTNYPQLLGLVGIYTSIMSKEDKLKEREKKLILSTTKSAGLGEDIKGLKMTVVLAEPFKSEVLTRQTLGRTRDDNTMYIELVDLGFRNIRSFYYSKLPTLNKYAKSVSDTTFDQYELSNRSKILEDKQNKKHSPFVLYDERFFDYTQKESEEDES